MRIDTYVLIGFLSFFVLILCLQLTVMWKVVEKLLTPKSEKDSNSEEKAPAQGLKWSFAAGTNLLSGLGAKIDRESKEKLNEFARELRTFSVVDMSGTTTWLPKVTGVCVFIMSRDNSIVVDDQIFVLYFTSIPCVNCLILCLNQCWVA